MNTLVIRGNINTKMHKSKQPNKKRRETIKLGDQ